jgi:hypothetical protein
MDNGLSQAQAAEVLTHIAYYVGWQNVFSALPVAKEVFDKRPTNRPADSTLCEGVLLERVRGEH